MSAFSSTLPITIARPRALMPLGVLLALVACSDTQPVAPARAPLTPAMAANAGSQTKPSKLAFTIRHLSERYSIWTVNSDGTELAQVTSGMEPDESPSWSPDRKKLVFTRGSGAGREIMTVNANGSHLTPLGVMAFRPRWSPDGKKILFAAHDFTAGNRNIYTINADGSNLVRLTDDPGMDSDPTFSPDGQKIAFSSDRTGTYEIYVMNADGTGATQITACGSEQASCGQASWSPVPGDTRILFRINPPVNKTRVINADGTGLTDVLGVLSSAAVQPMWSPDATRIAFLATLLGETAEDVWTAKVDGTGADRVTFSSNNKGETAWAR